MLNSENKQIVSSMYSTKSIVDSHTTHRFWRFGFWYSAVLLHLFMTISFSWA